MQRQDFSELIDQLTQQMADDPEQPLSLNGAVAEAEIEAEPSADMPDPPEPEAAGETPQQEAPTPLEVADSGEMPEPAQSEEPLIRLREESVEAQEVAETPDREPVAHQEAPQWSPPDEPIEPASLQEAPEQAEPEPVELAQAKERNDAGLDSPNLPTAEELPPWSDVSVPIKVGHTTELGETVPDGLGEVEPFPVQESVRRSWSEPAGLDDPSQMWTEPNRTWDELRDEMIQITSSLDQKIERRLADAIESLERRFRL